MQDAKTGGSRWVPDIREDEITEFQEQNGDETATYKAVNVHPIISRVLDKFAFFRTHVSAVWYNKLANKTVKDKLDEIDTSINSLNSRIDNNCWNLLGGILIPKHSDLNEYNQIGNYYVPADSVAATLKNYPFSPKAAFTMKVEFGTGIAYPCQTLRNYNTGDIAYRVQLESGWSTWRYIHMTTS